jgi:LuxR family maltose regulon positive regulatory protein
VEASRAAQGAEGSAVGLQSHAALELDRQRLLALDKGQPIMVAEAPSGFGKTVLARSWLRQAPKATLRVWLSLTDEDRDPTVFLERLSLALFGPGSRLWESALDDEADRADRFSRIADRLSDAQRPTWLVFDDAHCLAGSPSRLYLQRLLAGAGAHLRIFITLQPVALDVSLGELTARGKACWINAGTLALTRAEIEACARLRDQRPEAQQLDWLLRATQGWPALVQLALATSPDSGRYVPGNIARLGPVREYIYERFLTRLEPSEHEMAWTLACVGKIPLDLLRALSATRTDPDTELPRLLALGIVQQDDTAAEVMIHLHPLVSEAMLRALSQERAARKTQLQLAAADWYWRHGSGAAAVRLLLESDAEHLPQARDWLVELSNSLVFRNGQHQTLLDLVEHWEHVASRSDSQLDRVAAWALIFQRRFSAAEDRLQRASLGGGEDAADEMQLQLAVSGALQDDYDNAGRLAWAWLQRHPGEYTFHSAAAWSVYGFHLKCVGDIAGASAALREAHIGYNKTQSGFGTTWAFLVGALAMIKMGRHRDALAEVERGLERCREASGLGGQRAMLRSVEAFIRYERNELAAVTDVLSDVLVLLPDQGAVDTITLGYTAAARLRAASGDIGAALDILSEGERYGIQREFPRLSISLLAERALLLLRSGATGQARQVAEAAGLVPDATSIGGLKWDRAGRLFARLALVEGEFEQARRLIDPLIAHSRTAMQRYKLCELLILSALAHELHNDEPAAFAALREALSLASAESYVRLFLDEGSELHRLLGRWLKSCPEAVRSQPEASWAERILATLDSAQLRQKPAGDAPFEPLNKRERQILTLLEQGLSNAEIAARCFLVEGTVKWNLHNLYGKLGVRSRTAALRAARAHGILQQ